MSFRRECLDCRELTAPGDSRCADHTKVKEKQKRAVRGRTPVADRVSRTVRKLTAERCASCALVYPSNYLRVDHVLPLSDGGVDGLGNLQLLCVDCHRLKTSAEATARAYNARGDERYGF